MEVLDRFQSKFQLRDRKSEEARRHLFGMQLFVDGRGAAVELEGVPDHADLVRVLELLERELEVAAAEVAEGAEDVGPDVDAHPPRVGHRPRRDARLSGVRRRH